MNAADPDPSIEKTKITLTWSKLRSIHDFTPDELKKAKKSGVYVWGFQIGSKFIPYYVGMSSNLNERALQHYARFRGGEYAIYHSSSMEMFTKDKGSPNPDANQGLLYVPTGLHALANQFLHPNVQNQLAILLDSFRITFGTSDHPFDTSIVEQGLADYFGREFIQSSVAEGTKAWKVGPKDHDGDPVTLRLFDEASKDVKERVRIDM